MMYLIVGVDHDSLAPWHENIGARDVTTAKGIASAHARERGISLVVAAAVGPNSAVVQDPAPVVGIGFHARRVTRPRPRRPRPTARTGAAGGP
jgi:hypothetical protein